MEKKNPREVELYTLAMSPVVSMSFPLFPSLLSLHYEPMIIFSAFVNVSDQGIVLTLKAFWQDP